MILSVEEALNKTSLTIQDLKKLADSFFAIKKQELGLTKIRLVYRILPKTYGSISLSSNSDNIDLSISLYKFLTSKDSNIKKIFNLYNNIIHEFEHAKSFEKTKSENYFDYEQLMILLEYLCYARIFNIDIGKRKIGLMAMINIRKLLQLNYSISTSEIKSRLVAYKETLAMFAPHLKEEDIRTYEQIIKSLESLNDNIEIMYDENKKPVNKFSTIIKHAQMLVIGNKGLVQEYGILKNIFNDDGSVRSIYEIYNNINDENRVMYDKLIINLFLSVSIDLTPYFEDEEFKRYIEQLVDRYNNKIVYFFKNMELGKIFVDNEKPLRDNLRMQKQSVLLLNELCKFYDLKRNSGIVLDYTLRKNIKIGSIKVSQDE